MKKKKTTQYPLTIKQESFCVHVVDNCTASEAYRRSYDCKNMKATTINRNAKTSMDNSKIIARIAELRKPILKKLAINAEYVLGNIDEIGKRCMQAVSVKDDLGNVIGYAFKENGALKAQELLGRHLKLFTDVIEIKETLTPEQEEDSLAKIAEILKRRKTK